MESSNRRYSKSFNDSGETPKDETSENSGGAETGRQNDARPLLRRILLRTDGTRTPDHSSYNTMKQRAYTDVKRRNESPNLRRQLRYSASSDCMKTKGLTLPSSPMSLSRSPFSRQGQHSRLYKVIVVGEVNTGKSAIVRRYVHNFFSDRGDYRATLGVDFNLKLIHYNDELEIRLQLWDIAGQERFCNMTRAYYKGAVGALIVFDWSNAKTFEAVDRWKRDLDSKCFTPDGQRIPCILICNKADLRRDPRLPTEEEIYQYLVNQGFVGHFFKTSAKTGEGIQDAMNQMVRYIMSIDTWSCPLFSSMDADEESDLSTISTFATSTEDDGSASNLPENIGLVSPKKGLQRHVQPSCAC